MTQEINDQDRNSIASLQAAQHDGKIHLLLAASGSVATIKIPDIIQALGPYVSAGKLSIRLILTESARHFLADQSPSQPTPAKIPFLSAIYTDASEWPIPGWNRSSPTSSPSSSGVLHIELRRWADILVIAPLSANTLAKIVHGLADNLLTSVVRAWDVGGRIDGKRKRIVVAPAMNTAMWLHPITARQISVLRDEWGVRDLDGDTQARIEGSQEGWFEVLMPQQKTLACGDVGDGAMKEWTEVVRIIEARLELQKSS